MLQDTKWLASRRLPTERFVEPGFLFPFSFFLFTFYFLLFTFHPALTQKVLPRFCINPIAGNFIFRKNPVQAGSAAGQGCINCTGFI